MKEKSKSLRDLVSAIADGDAVNWEGLESSLDSDEERRVLESLKVIARVYQSHRTIHMAGAPHVVSPDEASPLPGVSGARTPPSGAPTRWGSFEILDRVGEGGFSEVYLARDPQLDRQVALKLLKPTGGREEERTADVLEEGRLLASVRHANVVSVHGVDIHDGRIGLWMEFIHGRTLADLISHQGPFAAREAIMVGLDLCRAVAAVHAAGLVHRDIKPRNVMREEGGRIVLMDFGSAWRFLDRDEGATLSASGTPLYMAPEVLLGGESDVSVDIYSLGVLLFHLATGSYPVLATTLEGLRTAHRKKRARRLRDLRPDLPEGFVQVVEKALAPDPEKRFASPGEMERALLRALGIVGESIGGGESSGPTAENPRRGGRTRMWLLVVAGLAAIAAGVSFLVPFFSDGSSDRVAVAAPSELPESTPAYTVEARLFRRTSAGRERLVPGTRIRPGDELFLEFEASEAVFVYVLNEDERGEGFVLFPMARSSLENPLPPGRHRLPGAPREPGASGATQLLWQVTSSGEREHFLIVASPERLAEIESDIATASRPSRDRPAEYAALSQASSLSLRGVGGIVERRGDLTEVGTTRIFDRVKRLANRPEEVRGVWIRQIDLENP